MKPVLIHCRGRAFMCLYPQSVLSTGRQLQVIYETGEMRLGWGLNGNFGAVIEQENFDWPWDVTIGAESTGVEDMVIF